MKYRRKSLYPDFSFFIMRIFLIGYMCSGKTTVGRKLANRLGLEFVDMDDYFEEKYKLSIMDFFDKYDEKLFRDFERKNLLELVKAENLVVSTGGGTPCFFDNLQLMKENGVVIYLQMQPKSLLHRIENSKKPRPLLEKAAHGNLQKFVSDQLTEREVSYLLADHVIKGENVDVNDICKILNKC